MAIVWTCKNWIPGKFYLLLMQTIHSTIIFGKKMEKYYLLAISVHMHIRSVKKIIIWEFDFQIFCWQVLAVKLNVHFRKLHDGRNKQQSQKIRFSNVSLTKEPMFGPLVANCKKKGKKKQPEIKDKRSYFVLKQQNTTSLE